LIRLIRLMRLIRQPGAVKKARGPADRGNVDPSDTLLERLLGVTEALAAYGDALESTDGARLASAARETRDLFWTEAHTLPPGSRGYRDEMFALLLNTRR
jgi:hypothetical protein